MTIRINHYAITFFEVSIKFCSSYGSNISGQEKPVLFGLPNWISGKVKAMPELL
jgi:hypothetical protein